MDTLRSFLIKKDSLIGGIKWLERPSCLIGCIGGSFLLFFALASFLTIDRVVRVEGKVIPTGHSRPIQHLEGGIVSLINVHEGDVVKEGDVLLSIDATSADANLTETKVQRDSLRLRTARLFAETGKTTDIKFPEDLAETDAAHAERNLYLSRKTKLNSDIKIHAETIRQYEAELAEANSKSKSLQEELIVARKRVGMVEKMVTRQAASQMELLEAQSRETRLSTEIRDAENVKPKIQAALATERARMQAIINDFRSDAEKDLVAAQSEIDRLSGILTAADDRVKRTEIRAPIGGTINRLTVTSVGAVIKPGESFIELTPASQEVLIEARVPPKDRGEMKVGIDAKVRVTAYDSAALGALEGRLQEISADTMPDAKGDAYYRAKITIGHMPHAYDGKPVLPGMTIIGDLVLGKRTVLAHLLSPLRKFSNNMFRDPR